MITDIPNSDFFLERCVNYHYFALNNLLTLLCKFEYMEFEDLECELLDIESELWEYLDIELGNIILLLFNSIENYLKYRISLITPYLLLETPIKDWKWSNKAFHEFYIHPFDSLLKIFAVTNIEPSDHVRQKFEELRVSRNLYIHGAKASKTTPYKIIEISYLFLTELWGETLGEEKISIFRKFLESGYLEIDEECEARAGELMDDHNKIIFFFSFYQKVMGKKKALKVLGIEAEDEMYNCNLCEEQTSNILKDSYLAIKSGEEVITCRLCQSEYNLIR
ncbi:MULTISPECIES: hypothetical protein [Acinetobacter]|uniref:hypothetical protein n=1 Tax=Acinetobacter TaxID=469 RepID=UPI000991CE24|nr:MULTISPECIES: hypothetical protein [Acinetobacter]MCL6246046.1 hypothetical protein [Acinetobacter amyesii]OOV82100.1 hypothetical protein B1201_07510 [Acinetobacter sp. ANC 5600]